MLQKARTLIGRGEFLGFWCKCRTNKYSSSYRQVLEEKARQRKMNRSKSIHEKSHTVSNLCNIRKELAEDPKVSAEIKSVLCPRKAPAVKQGKNMSESRYKFKQ